MISWIVHTGLTFRKYDSKKFIFGAHRMKRILRAGLLFLISICIVWFSVEASDIPAETETQGDKPALHSGSVSPVPSKRHGCRN